MAEATQYLNMDVLNELRQVMGDEFSLLIETFEVDSLVRIEEIKAAVAASDPEAIRRAAHSFKGSTGNMGATLLTELCRELEELGRSGQSLGAEPLVVKIIDAYAKVKIALETL